jgi:tetratricopeptide (TPR) repeat protein
MKVCPAPIAAVTLVVSLLSVAAEPQEKKQEQKKLNPQELKRMAADGDRLMAEGKMADARRHFLTVLEQEPANVPVALKLGRTCESIQDWDGAIAAYQKVAASAQGPERAEGLAGLAGAYVRTRQFKEAADSARKAIELNPAAAPAHVSLAYSLVRLGSTEEAIPAARKAIELAPTSAVAHAALGEALLRDNKVADAEATFRKALELDPKAADALAGLADLQCRKADYSAAEASAAKALELDPNQARAYSVRGRVNLARGQLIPAQGDLATAIARDSTDVEAQLALAQIQRKQNNLTGAVTSYRRVLSLDPSRGSAYLELGEILVSQGDLTGARDPLEKAAERMPDSGRAQYLLGVVYEKGKDLERALQAYSRAAELDPNLAEAHHGRGRLLRELKKDAPGALASLEKAAALSPDNGDVLTDLGVALYDAKQVDKAGDALSKAVKTADYRNPLGFGVYGLVLKDKQNFAEAAGWFEKAAAGSPKWWIPHWGAAWSYFGLIKKGCPCSPEDEERVKKIKEHFDQMIALQGKDPALEQRVDALTKGQKVK